MPEHDGADAEMSRANTSFFALVDRDLSLVSGQKAGEQVPSEPWIWHRKVVQVLGPEGRERWGESLDGWHNFMMPLGWSSNSA